MSPHLYNFSQFVCQLLYYFHKKQHLYKREQRHRLRTSPSSAGGSSLSARRRLRRPSRGKAHTLFKRLRPWSFHYLWRVRKDERNGKKNKDHQSGEFSIFFYLQKLCNAFWYSITEDCKHRKVSFPFEKQCTFTNKSWAHYWISKIEV